MNRCYSDLRHIHDYYERFDYLSLNGRVAERTFGAERHLNQGFYRSMEWRRARRNVIARDLGCDMGIEGYDLFTDIHVHHMNPMVIDDLMDFDPKVLDPEFLITVSQRTHNAIHYGDVSLLPQPVVERRPGDTTVWKRNPNI